MTCPEIFLSGHSDGFGDIWILTVAETVSVPCEIGSPASWYLVVQVTILGPGKSFDF